jgi:uncharacterized protein (DUF433 family)
MHAITDSGLTPTRGDLGTGVYGLTELRAFVAFDGTPEDGKKVPSWLRAILNPVTHEPKRADYSFSDLVSLFVVRELLRKGVAPRKIRIAEAWMREELRIDRPFVSEEIKTDGVEVFFRDEVIPDQIEAASREGQQTMREMIRDKLASVHYTDGRAASWAPMAGVVLDPRVQFGEPVVEGTRIPTSTVASVARTLGADRAGLRFALVPKDIRRALAFEDRIASLS